MAFGEQLQLLRRRSGLTQEQFAEELRVSRQAVSKWESGKGYPEVEKLLYICQRYDVTLNDLFEQGENEPISQEISPAVPLKASVSAFVSNLSPRNKWLSAGILLGVALLAGFMGLCLKGGKAEMEMIVWIAAMVVFGVVEAVTVGLVSIWFVLGSAAGLSAGILLGVALLAGFMGLCLKGGKAEMEMIVWIAAMVVFGVVEAVTVGLVSIWFVLGSAAGLIAAICEAPIWLQVLLFFIVSIAALIATRPLVRKMMDKNIVPTNADAVLGKEARVTEAIDNTVPSGAVYVDGKTWSARSESGETLPEGTLVRTVRMEGVKLFVERL